MAKKPSFADTAKAKAAAKAAAAAAAKRKAASLNVTKPVDYISGNYKKRGDKYKAWQTYSKKAPDFGKGMKGPGTPYKEVTKTATGTSLNRPRPPIKNPPKFPAPTKPMPRPRAPGLKPITTQGARPASWDSSPGIDPKTAAIRRRLANG